MSQAYKGQTIMRILGDKIGDIYVEAVAVLPGPNGQILAFMGKAPTREAALAEATRLAQRAVDDSTKT